jgi:hypothetical protein
MISTNTDGASTICSFPTTLPISQDAVIKTNSRNLNQLNTTHSQPSNLIPHFWNYKIVDKEGSPDLPCIIILSELFGWFRNLSQSKTYYSTGTDLPELVEGKLAISYEFLSDKLNFHKERIRRNLVKLEALGILSRDVKNIALENGSRIKQLYLSIDPDFFKSCFRNPDLDIRVGNSDSSHSTYSDFKRTPLLSGEHISKKNNNRSMISNSIKKDFEGEDSHITDTEISQQNTSSSLLKEDVLKGEEINFNTKPLLQQSKQRKLEDFYPLSKEDCYILQSSSEREFSLNAMNEILKNMSKRITNRFFYSKKGFLAYMSQAFRYEKRDAVKINNIDFRIKANLDEGEQTIQKEEKYLTELEYSLQVSPEWHLKKKLASVLERSKAYKLLTSYKTLEIKEGGLCRLELSRAVGLTTNDKEIILNQIKATHSNVGLDSKTISINEVEFVMPKYKKLSKSFSPRQQWQSQSSNKSKDLQQVTKSNKTQTIWDQIRAVLAKQYGDGIDKAWFSKLSANINNSNKEITLKSSSEFVIDWINNNYSQTIRNIASNFEFKLEIECVY